MLLLLMLSSVLSYAVDDRALRKSPHYQSALEIVESDKADIEGLVSFIRTHYPSDQYTYVSVGRSPSVISVYMRLLGESVHNLPATGLRNHPIDFEFNAESVSKHFKRHLPSGLDKKVLFIDFSIVGLAFVRLEQVIKVLMDKNLIEFSEGFEFLVMADSEDYKLRIQELYSKHLTHQHQVYFLDEFAEHFLSTLLGEKYDPFSEYLPYDMIRDTELTPYKNPLHASLVASVEDSFEFGQNEKRLTCESLLK